MSESTTPQTETLQRRIARMVWENMYPDRRDFDKIDQGAQEEWELLMLVCIQTFALELTASHARELALREALRTCHPANVWDHARQYYTAEVEPEVSVLRNIHNDRCKAVNEALSSDPPPVVSKAEFDALKGCAEELYTLVQPNIMADCICGRTLTPDWKGHSECCDHHVKGKALEDYRAKFPAQEEKR